MPGLFARRAAPRAAVVPFDQVPDHPGLHRGRAGVVEQPARARDATELDAPGRHRPGSSRNVGQETLAGRLADRPSVHAHDPVARRRWDGDRRGRGGCRCLGSTARTATAGRGNQQPRQRKPSHERAAAACFVPNSHVVILLVWDSLSSRVQPAPLGVGSKRGADVSAAAPQPAQSRVRRDPDCWCRRTALDRALKWWLPGHTSGCTTRTGSSSSGGERRRDREPTRDLVASGHRSSRATRVRRRVGVPDVRGRLNDRPRPRAGRFE